MYDILSKYFYYKFVKTFGFFKSDNSNLKAIPEFYMRKYSATEALLNR
jgi:hypothetical protein